MRMSRDEVNWKGIGDYLSAARTLTEHGSPNTSGPRMMCQGLALELALKFLLRDAFGEYPETHDLRDLVSRCESRVEWTDEEHGAVETLNLRYRHDGENRYPARYRPIEMQAFGSPGQDLVEQMVTRVVSSASRSDLVQSILAR